MKRHATQKRTWKMMNLSEKSQSGKYVFVTVKHHETQVWVHSCIAFEWLEPKWHLLQYHCRPEEDWFNFFNAIQSSNVKRHDVSLH